VTPFLAIAGTLAAQAATLPDAAAVQGAREEYLNRGCDDGYGNCNHPFAAQIRRLRCQTQANGGAHCRFDERLWHFYERHPRWQRVHYPFVYDAERSRWALDCREEVVQSTGPVTQIATRCN
jgi:hypothetical protein